jgi:hypothetical protein
MMMLLLLLHQLLLLLLLPLQLLLLQLVLLEVQMVGLLRKLKVCPMASNDRGTSPHWYRPVHHDVAHWAAVAPRHAAVAGAAVAVFVGIIPPVRRAGHQGVGRGQHG